MKKLIAISITLVLLASAAFAEVSVGGLVGEKWDVVNGSTEDGKDDIMTKWAKGNGRIQIVGKTDDGVFGGIFRAGNVGWGRSDETAYAYAWWQPISQFKLGIGFQDGVGATHYVTGWGFHQGAEDYVALAGYGKLRGGAFFAGFGSGIDDAYGVAATITPMDGLAILVGVPYVSTGSTGITAYGGTVTSNENEGTAANIFNHTVVQVSYTIDGIGNVAVSFAGGGGHIADDPNRIFAAFNLTAVENLGFDIGVHIPLEQKGYGDDPEKKQQPIAVGFGATYAVNDAFGVKARFYMDFLGSTTAQGKNEKAQPTPYTVQFELLPYYDLGIMKAFLAVGGSVILDHENDAGNNIGKSNFGWWVNPYVSKAVGGGTFFAGFQLSSGLYNIYEHTSTKQDPKFGKPYEWKNWIQWSIPVGIQYSF